VPMGSVTSDSEHYVWLRNGGANGWCYRLILNIMYGSQMEVPLSIVKKSDFEHYIWIRNGGASLEIRKRM